MVPLSDVHPAAMRYDRNLVVANAIAAAALVFSLVRLLVWTGNFHWNVAAGLLPMVLTFIAMRPGSRRSVGGIAIVFNGLLVAAGALALLFSVMSTDRVDASSNMLGLAYGAVLLLTGILNVRAIWHTVPVKRPSVP